MLRVAVVGGDERARRLATLCDENFSVMTLGLREGDEASADLKAADVLLLPYPYAVKNTSVPNLRGINIDPSDVMAGARSGAFLMAGDGLDPYIAAVLALGKTFTVRRYQEDVAFLQDNADISAEGALSYAMQQMEVSVAGTTALVVGYGNFGRALAQKLRGLDGNVIVGARSDAARRKARSDGMRAVDLTEMIQIAGDVRLLMNTVPARVISQEMLGRLPQNALLLELASAPFGFDLKMAESMGLCAAVLPGIPARYAPESAAKALYEAMNRLLMEGKG